LPKGKPHSKHYGPLRQYERFKYIFLQLSRKRKFSLLSPAFGARKVRFIFFVLGKKSIMWRRESDGVFTHIEAVVLFSWFK
jgi:hypothetical protein